MADFRLTIQHGDDLFEPPLEEGVQIEWERTSSAGKLTFTTITMDSAIFTEGDVVRFYFFDEPIFVGYVFKKKRDRENHITVTCYDQLRYLKNKFTYVFEKKTATEIIKALCSDFQLNMGTIEDTKYVIPAIAEENKAALDIILEALEETLTNTGNMFVFYDNCGKLELKNVTSMVVDTAICDTTAENFDYSSSIDDETYNSVVLYYDVNSTSNSDVFGAVNTQVYTANSPSRIADWGLLRYFEKVDNPSIGQNKANSLLKLYNKKTRELKVTGAFGNIDVRGGTMIPVILDLGDSNISNYMLVDKVVHKFDKDYHSMDVTLEGSWSDDTTTDMVSKTIGSVPKVNSGSSGGGASGFTALVGGGGGAPITKPKFGVTIYSNGIKSYAGKITIYYTYDGSAKSISTTTGAVMNVGAMADKGTSVTVKITPKSNCSYTVYNKNGTWSNSRDTYVLNNINKNVGFTVKWLGRDY
jgi:hypothetical protein